MNGYFACDFSRTLFSNERTWRDVRCASNLSHSKTRMGGGIPVDIPNLLVTRPADRYWPEIPDSDLNKDRAVIDRF
jgi:hypothetical protein